MPPRRPVIPPDSPAETPSAAAAPRVARVRLPRPMTRAQIAAFFDTLAATIVPESELRWQTPLDLVVAVVLSAQCTDKAVNKATAALFERCRTPEDYVALGVEGLQGYIRSIGLFRNKATHIVGLCERLIALHGGQVPDTREALQALPGVGRKTANVVLNVAFGQSTLAVDTHILRVANRVGLVRARTPDATERELVKVIPVQHLRDSHHLLILHGRYVCKARRPECWRCSVAAYCNALEKSSAPE